MVIDGARYTAAAALAAESTSLFRRYPLLVALGCEIPRPGNYLAFDIAGVPVLLVRDDKGSVHGLLNTCRHRGARLLAGEGTVGKAFACPYHGWAYDRCGVLRALPESEHFPEVDVDDTRLMRFPTEERDGLVWLLLDPAASEVPDPGLDALGPELARLPALGTHPPGQPHLDQADELEAWDRHVPGTSPRGRPPPANDRQDDPAASVPV